MEWLSSITETTSGVGPTWIPITVGSVLLLFGRRLYGVLLASAGFALGFTVVDRLATGVSAEATLLFALALGVGGAILAFFVQRVALAVAGFVLGGLATLWMVELLGRELHGAQTLIVLAGAVAGLFTFRKLFGAALIAFSSLIGASFIVQATGLGPPASVAAVALLVAVGVLSQRKNGDRKSRRRQRRRQTATVPET